MIELIFIRIGMFIFLILGLLHLAYTIADLLKPKYFAPVDSELLSAMRSTRIRLRKNVHSFWRSYLGFHLSHSAGLVIYSITYIGLTFTSPELVVASPFIQIMTGASLLYAIISYWFWFSIPFIGSLIALGMCILAIIFSTAAG